MPLTGKEGPVESKARRKQEARTDAEVELKVTLFIYNNFVFILYNLNSAIRCPVGAFVPFVCVFIGTCSLVPSAGAFRHLHSPHLAQGI